MGALRLPGLRRRGWTSLPRPRPLSCPQILHAGPFPLPPRPSRSCPRMGPGRWVTPNVPCPHMGPWCHPWGTDTDSPQDPNPGCRVAPRAALCHFGVPASPRPPSSHPCWLPTTPSHHPRVSFLRDDDGILGSQGDVWGHWGCLVEVTAPQTPPTFPAGAVLAPGACRMLPAMCPAHGNGDGDASGTPDLSATKVRSS